MATAPGHHALRKGRHSHLGGVYLVTFTTHSRRQLFSDFAPATAACRTFEPSARAESASLLCWVLMPDHFHALIRLDGARPLSNVVQRIKSTSSRACAAADCHAPIWARSFHDHALRCDEDLLATARYIVANPVRARLARRARDYPFWNAIWL